MAGQTLVLRAEIYLDSYIRTRQAGETCTIQVSIRFGLPYSCCESSLSLLELWSYFTSVQVDGWKSRHCNKTLSGNAIKPNTIHAIHKSPFWSLMADESTDSATMEQLGVYVRYADVEKSKFVTWNEMGRRPSKHIWQLNGNFTSRKPWFKVASCGIYKWWSICHDLPKMESWRSWEVNPKLFSTHCPPHRLVLAAKGQRELPDDVEKTISDTLFFF